MDSAQFDTIVIGSGAGGLTAALCLAKAGLRVLVCEQHEVPGGWMHSFTMDGYRFNTGVHYIGELGEGEKFHDLFTQLGLLEGLEFVMMNPDGYDHVLIGKNRFDIPAGSEAYINRLIERFPTEEKGIRQLFKKIAKIDSALQCLLLDRWWSLVRFPTVLPWLIRSGQALIDAHVKDPLLKGILCAQAGNHGMPPSQVSAPIHATIMQHYINGGYHPRSGGMAIARALVRALKNNGGNIRLSTPVKRIIIESGNATGIELADGERITSKNVISNADPHTTFAQLVGDEHLSRRLSRRLTKLTYSTSCLSLYLVLERDPRDWGIDSGNFWLYDDEDIDLHYLRGLTDYNVYHQPSALFVTATSIKDPSKMKPGSYQIEVFTFVSYDAFSRWAHLPQGDRGEDYQKLKSDIIERMLQALDARFPEISRYVIWKELGTPLSNEHYVRSHKGNMYGIAKSVAQSGPLSFSSRTEIGHLYMCGASTIAHGVVYSMTTGITAAARVLGCPVSSLWENQIKAGAGKTVLAG